jgi:type IV pilus assembly protein PilX
MNSFRNRVMPGARKQRGVALVVALVLLVVATLIGLAASRSTMLQERMSGNSFDRSLAFQRSESALRAAETAITADYHIAVLNGVDCSPATSTQCDVLPADTFTGTSANWVDVVAAYDINSALAVGVPQYQIHMIGTGLADSNYGINDNANINDYGAGNAPETVMFYRVTARSSNPAVSGDRAIVVLQTTVMRPY